MNYNIGLRTRYSDSLFIHIQHLSGTYNVIRKIDATHTNPHPHAVFWLGGQTINGVDIKSEIGC